MATKATEITLGPDSVVAMDVKPVISPKIEITREQSDFDPDKKTDSKTHRPGKDYVVLMNAHKGHYDKIGNGSASAIDVITYIDIWVTLPKDEQPFEKDIKEGGVLVSDSSKELIFFHDKSCKSEHKVEAVIPYSKFKKENKSGVQAAKYRLYLSATINDRNLKNTELGSIECTFKAEVQVHFTEHSDTEYFASTHSKATIDVEIESVDIGIRKNVVSAIKDPTKFPKSRVAAAQSCFHKLGYKNGKASSIRTNPTTKELDKFLALFLKESKNGKFGLYIKPENSDPVEVIDRGDVYQEVEHSGKAEPRTWPKLDYVLLNKIEKINIDSLLDEYLKLYSRITQSKPHDTIRNEIKNALNTIINLPNGVIPNAPRTGYWKGGTDWNTGNKAPGLHAEVQAVNDALIFLDSLASNPQRDHITVATFHLAGNEESRTTTEGKIREAKRLTDFPACNNCTQILSPLVRIPTGSMLDI